MSKNHASCNKRAASGFVLAIAVVLLCSPCFADNKALARIIFDEAKASYEVGRYDAALSQLDDAQAKLGSTNAPIASLKIKIRYRILSSSAHPDKVEAEALRKDARDYLEMHGDDERLEVEAREIYRIYDALGRPLHNDAEKSALHGGNDAAASRRVDCKELERTTAQLKEYMESSDKMVASRFGEAKLGFLQFIKNHPCSEVTSSAHFWVARIYEDEGSRDAAIEHYNFIVSEYPSSDKVLTALYRRGMLEIEKGQGASGAATLRDLIRRFPDSQEATMANQTIESIEGSR